MKTFGYCRISTKKQSIERQIRNILREYPDADITEEAYTGTTVNRNGWQRLLRAVRPGDTIVFDSVSRMSRNATEGFEAYESLYNEGVNLVFLKEPHINTETYKKALSNNVAMTGDKVDFILEGINRYLMELAREQIRIAFEQAEKEVEDLRQRTKEGIETARRNGKQIGRKEGATVTTEKSKGAKAKILQYSKDFGGAVSDTDLMQMTGLARNTYYKYKKELKEQEGQ